ncbi:MAG TPA: peptidylprolyl isomerase [Paludibacteraceae bacterium]|jgi:peptidyl-prolyl cis-trans isomerase SurA|nr:peptidylprolyl isomerase [Paludibacteraceae bacterium]
MKTKSIFCIALTLAVGMGLKAQQNRAAAAFTAMPKKVNVEASPVLMTIDGRDITQAEFEYIYNKNNTNNAIDKKTLDEYVDLFINFKLKVIEAENTGLDTMPSFINELAGYRTQLAKPYLTDRVAEEKECRKEYERLKQEVEVSHILVRIEDPDTLIAYKKAMDAYTELLRGKDFATVAKKYSEDPSALENGGYLGYFTALMTVEPFENAMYTLPIGKISRPIRTYYGYHVIKVHSRRPTVGKVKVSHIMKQVHFTEDSLKKVKAKEDIDALYQRVKNGENFAELAKQNSDDRGSAQRGGELNWFGVGQMVREFEQAAFALKEKGDVSQPVKSHYGWHIIKLIDKKGLEPYEKKEAEIMRALQNDERSLIGQRSFLKKLRKDYKYKVDEIGLQGMYQLVQMYPLTDSLFSIESAKYTIPLFSFADKTYSQLDFSEYLIVNPHSSATEAWKIVNEKLDNFVDRELMAYEDAQLENKYPDFRFLMQEYHDGILLFEISNREVWEKATKDEEGLNRYFGKHKAEYAWNEPHFKGHIFSCKDKETAKLVKKLLKKAPIDSIDTYVSSRINNDSVTFVKVEKGLWKNGDKDVIDKLAFKKKGVAVVVPEDLPIVFIDGKMLKKGPENYKDVRGAVTSDYRDWLETEWVKDLRAKYPVKINQEVLKLIKE